MQIEEDDSGPFPASWWTEDDGPVLWWAWDKDDWLGEAPYVGTPLDFGFTVEARASDNPDKVHQMSVGGWPGYHTHWTRIPKPRHPNT